MPICRTCRGEYECAVHRERVCAQCGEPVESNWKLCHSCGTKIEHLCLCPRCKSDVSVWEEESLTLTEFILQGGSVGLLPSLLALVIWIFVWELLGTTVHHPLTTLVSISLSLLTFMILYIKRLYWRERWWASQVYNVTAPSLVTTIVIAFVAGLFLSVVSFVLYQEIQSPVNYLQRLLFSLAYAPIYICFTIALTLFVVQSYGERLDERVPPPIFADTNRLLHVVVEGAIQSLNMADEDEDLVGRWAAEEEEEDYEVKEVVRSPHTGGISVLLQERKRLCPDGAEREGEVEGEVTVWRVDADRWGRLQAVRAGGAPRQEAFNDDFPRAYGRYS
ncbi:MAG: zinc ribbon domain-containing protein [Anaerolineales bacterium]